MADLELSLQYRETDFWIVGDKRDRSEIDNLYIGVYYINDIPIVIHFFELLPGYYILKSNNMKCETNLDG